MNFLRNKDVSTSKTAKAALLGLTMLGGVEGCGLSKLNTVNPHSQRTIEEYTELLGKISENSAAINKRCREIYDSPKSVLRDFNQYDFEEGNPNGVAVIEEDGHVVASCRVNVSEGKHEDRAGYYITVREGSLSAQSSVDPRRMLVRIDGKTEEKKFEKSFLVLRARDGYEFQSREWEGAEYTNNSPYIVNACETTIVGEIADHKATVASMLKKAGAQTKKPPVSWLPQ